MIASNSNASEVTLDDLYYLLQDYSSDSSGIDSDVDMSSSFSGHAMGDSEMDIFGSEYAESVITYNPVQMAEISSWNYINCLRLDCNVLGDDVTVLFPPASIDGIYIDDAGRLWNMTTSNIIGRIVEGEFNPYATDVDLVYLTPCLGNNISTIGRYGSPNYVRSYRWTGANSTYDDIYTEIVVNDYHYPFFASDMWNYGTVFLLFVGVLLAWLSNYRHY